MEYAKSKNKQPSKWGYTHPLSFIAKESYVLLKAISLMALAGVGLGLVLYASIIAGIVAENLALTFVKF